MTPQIEFARRPDGARTAYATQGSGPVLVLPPGGITHLQWYLGDTEAHVRFCERLARHRTLVIYDRHGCGMSDRRRTDFSVEDDMVDLETVVEAVGAETIDLFGNSWGGTPALIYASRHPGLVRRMVLYGTFAGGRRGPDAAWREREQALTALARTDWDLYCRTMATVFFPSGAAPDTFRSMVRMLRESTTPEMAQKLDSTLFDFDLQALLPAIKTPTLVLHRRGDQVCLFEWGQYMARRLGNARFVPLEGDAHYPWVDDMDSVLEPALAFLTEGEAEGAPGPSEIPASPSQHGTAVIFFADIAESTSLTEQLGDSAFRERARQLDLSLRTMIEDSGGTPVDGKVLGDGVMALFTSAREAIDCALACRAIALQTLPLHLGIHAGDVIREGKTAFGGAVNIAARVTAETGPNEILASDIVRGLARTSAQVTFTDRGEFDLKGIGEPLRLYRVDAP